MSDLHTSADEKRARRQLERSSLMLNGDPSKVIMKMALPTIIAFLINSIYSLADTYFVSSLGTNATAAVTVNSSLDQFIFLAGSLMAVGANSYIARLLGKGDAKEASRVLTTAWVIAFSLGLLVTIVCSIFISPVVRLLGATPTCEQYSIDYAKYVLYAAPLMAANFVMNQCLRAEGSAMLSMIGMSFGGILNCFLDPLFIFGLNLGVAGASMATALSKLVSFVILVTPYLTGHSMLHLHIKNFKPNRIMLWEIISVGSSSMLRSLLSVVAAVLLNKEAGTISDAVLAGIGVATRVMMFPFSIILGFGSGFQPVAGFNWGAKRYDRVKLSLRAAMKIAGLGSLVMALIVGIFSNQIIGLFTTTDAEMLAIGSLSIRLQCVALPIHALVAVVNMCCGGLGFAGSAVILATSRQGSCFIPILYPMTRLLGATGVAGVQALADVLTLIPAVPILLRMLRILNQKEAEQLAP